MKKVLSIILSITMLFSITAGVDWSACAASSTVSIGTNVTQKYDYANTVVSKVNSERSKKGKSKLKTDSTLTKYAMQRAAELALKYSHTRPNGKDCLTIAKKVNGENIQAGASTAAEAMEMWMSSKGHKDNILRSSFKSIGVGCVEINGYYFWVQLFSKSSGNGKKSTGTKYAATTVSILQKNLWIYVNTYDLGEVYANSDDYDGDMYDLDYAGLDYEAVPNGYQIKVGAVDMTNEFYSGVTDAIVDKSAFSYSSSNKDVLTVSSTGLMNVKKTGSATVTIKLKKNNKFKTTQRVNTRRSTTIKASKDTFVYDGNTHKPTISVYDLSDNLLNDYSFTYMTDCKSVGTHKIRITPDDYDYYYDDMPYESYYCFKILPKSTTISKVSASKKGFTVKWKKQTTQTGGYQIQYSTGSKFSSAKTVTVSKNTTTSKKITGLKAKKKYYVRIRTYKTVAGTKYYSSWSKAKSVKTK